MNTFGIRTGAALVSALTLGSAPVRAQTRVVNPHVRAEIRPAEKLPTDVRRATVAIRAGSQPAGGPPPSGPFNTSLVVSLDGTHWTLNDTLHYQNPASQPPRPATWFLHWTPAATDILWFQPASLNQYMIMPVDNNGLEAFNNSACNSLIDPFGQWLPGGADVTQWQSTNMRWVYPYSTYTCRYAVKVLTKQGTQQVPLYTNVVTVTVAR